MEQEHILPQPINELERPELYLNRELSLIEFNRRVFEEAKDVRHPLLERVKFISIFETNTDEFFMIRLAGLKDQVASRNIVRSPDGLTALQQLKAVRKTLRPLQQEVRDYWQAEIAPLLANECIFIRNYEQLDDEQRAAMCTYFEQQIFPVLTPLAVDAGHRFPHISNRSLNLAVVLTDDTTQEERFARLKVPPTLPRLVQLPLSKGAEGTLSVSFVWLEQVIAANLHMLFPGFDAWESYPFRVLRDADIELQEDEADDLLQYIEQEVRERRFGAFVDLTVNPSMPIHIRNLLIDNLELGEEDLTVLDGPLGVGDVMELQSLERPDLKDKPFVPRVPLFLQETEDMFEAIQKHDVLLHHPYDGFSSVVDFIRNAAEDPQVLAIKQTLYRVGGQNAPVVNALLQAVEKGKEVAVLVELKARFDEENNIVWARELEKAGVHVVYGLIGLKTHGKVAMVVRKESHGLRLYLHLGTGNYNVTTAKVYEDLGLLTCRTNLGIDTTALFNTLTGYSRQSNYRKLLVAPLGLRKGIIERIEREISLHQKHGNGRLIFKMNALADPDVIRYLYRASQAGIQVDLIIRGVCCLRPGVADISENIRVRSIVGRFLEHSRVYYFRNNGQGEIYLGSADMMQRNLNTRVEVLFPVESEKLRTRLVEHMLLSLLKDTVNSYQLQSDGTYKPIKPSEGEEPFDCQDWFISHPLFNVDIDEDVSNRTNTTISAIPSSA